MRKLIICLLSCLLLASCHRVTTDIIEVTGEVINKNYIERHTDREYKYAPDGDSTNGYKYKWVDVHYPEVTDTIVRYTIETGDTWEQKFTRPEVFAQFEVGDIVYIRYKRIVKTEANRFVITYKPYGIPSHTTYYPQPLEAKVMKLRNAGDKFTDKACQERPAVTLN